MQQRYSSRWLDIAAAICAASPVLIFAAGYVVTHFASVRGVLDGKEVFDTAANSNLIRNFLELLSFAASPVLAAIAIAALAFARKQWEEAEHTRLANLYSSIEERWSSPQIRDSLVRIYNIDAQYNGAGGVTKAEFFHNILAKLPYAAYVRTMGIADFFEYIGMMVGNDYLDIDDVSKLMRLSVINAYDLLAVHVRELRFSSPKAYAMFEALNERLKNR